MQPVCLEALKQYRVSLLSSNSSQERPNINFSVYFLRVHTSAMALNRGSHAPSLPLLGEGRRVPVGEHCVYSYRLCKRRDKHQRRKTKHLLLIHPCLPAHGLHLIICERKRYSLTLQSSLASRTGAGRGCALPDVKGMGTQAWLWTGKRSLQPCPKRNGLPGSVCLKP